MEETSRTADELSAASSSSDVLQFSEGCDMNERLSLETGRRALHTAATEGNVHMVRQLLDRGAKIDVRDYYGNTSLHYASRKGHVEVVRLLLDREADVNITNDDGCTILQNVVRIEHYEITRLLISKGANLDAYITHGSLEPCNLPNQLKTPLLNKQDTLNRWYSNKQKTVITLAFELGNLPLIHMLLEAGADVHKVSNLLVYLSIKKNNIDLVKLLMDKGVDFESLCIWERTTPLDIAVSFGCYEIMEILLDKRGWNGLYSLTTNEEEIIERTVELALNGGHWKIVRLLLQCWAQLPVGVRESALKNALIRGDNVVAQWLFEHGTKLCVSESWYSDLLHTVVINGNHEIIKLVTSTSTNIHWNIQQGKYKGDLILATKNKLVPIIDLLLENGADIKFTDDLGNTALYYAIENNESPNILQIFLTREASVDDIINTESRTTALHLAVSSKKKAFVEFLLLKGANVNAKDSFGNTPCHELFKYGFHEDFFNMFAKSFVARGANLTCTNVHGTTPIYLGMQKIFWLPIKELMGDTERLLLEEYFEIVKIDANNIKHFLIAIIGNNLIPLVKVFLNKIVEFYFNDGQEDHAMTDLHIAAHQGNINLSDIALLSGLSIDSVTKESFTALQIALYKNNTEMAQYLINKSANVSIEDMLGLLPVHVAFLLGEVTLVEQLFIKTQPLVSTVFEIPLLHMAAYCESIVLVRFLLFKGTDINTKDEENNTILHIAVKTKNLEVVNFLLESGIDANAQNRIGDTALHTALKTLHSDFTSPNFEMSKILLMHGININIPNSAKDTVLHLAASTPFAQLLLEKGVDDINAKNVHGLSAFHDLALHFHGTIPIDQIALFLKHGADITSKDNKGNFLLEQLLMNKTVNIKELEQECKVNFVSILPYHQISHIFCNLSLDLEEDNAMNQQRPLALMEVLLSQGLTLKPDEGKLDCRCSKSLLEHVMEERNIDLILLVLDKDKKLDINIVLSIAVEESKWKVIEIILNKMNVSTKDRYLVLTKAVKESNRKVIKILLDKMNFSTGDRYLVDLFLPDNRNKHGLAQIFLDRIKVFGCVNYFQLLFQLVKAGNWSNVEILLDKGVNIDFVDDLRNTALNYAISSGNKKLVYILLARDADVNMSNVRNETPVHIAARAGNVDILKMLVDKEAIVTTVDIDQNTPLHKTKSYKVAELLIDEGVSVNAQNAFKQTALHSIIELNSRNGDGSIEIEDVPKIAALLIEKGAEVDVKDKNGMTPLLLAAKNNYTITTTVLVEKGAQIDSKDHNGQTSLHHAVIKYRQRIKEYLLAEGALIDIKDNNGNTPYSFHYPRDKFDDYFLREKLAGLPTNEQIRGLLSREEEASCIEELNRMKLTQINDTFSVFDVLVRLQKSTAWFNENLVQLTESLFSVGFFNQFPKYKGIFRRAFIRSKLYLIRPTVNSIFNKAQNLFGKSLPEEILLEIFSFLSVEDLDNIIKSGSN